jgi:hypothetical protein
MLLFPLPPDHGLEGQLIAHLFGLEVFVELFPLGLGSAGFNAVGAGPKQSLDERVSQRGAIGPLLS